MNDQQNFICKIGICSNFVLTVLQSPRRTRTAVAAGGADAGPFIVTADSNSRQKSSSPPTPSHTTNHRRKNVFYVFKFFP